jgi:hypothetical protein
MFQHLRSFAVTACLALGVLVAPTDARAQQYTDRILNACDAWGWSSTRFYAASTWERRELGWWYIPAGSVISVTVYSANLDASYATYKNQRAPIERWNNGAPFQIYSWDSGGGEYLRERTHWDQGKNKDKAHRIMSQTVRVAAEDWYRVWPGNRGYGNEYITAWVKVYPAPGHSGHDPDCEQFWGTNNYDDFRAFSTMDYAHGMAGDGANCEDVPLNTPTCVKNNADRTTFLRDAYGWTAMKANPGAHAHDTCCTKSHVSITGVAANMCAGSDALFQSKEPYPNATSRQDRCRWEWDRAVDCQNKGDCARWVYTDPAESWAFGHDFASTGYWVAKFLNTSDGPGGTEIVENGYYFHRTGAQGYRTGGAVSSAYALYDWMCQGGFCDGNQYELNPAWWNGAHCKCTSSTDVTRFGFVP